MIPSFSDTRGSVAIYSALILIPIMLTVGLGVEFRQVSNLKQNLQTALDSSVMAAVVSSSGEDALAQGREVFKGNTRTVSMLNPVVSLTRIDANTVEGTAAASSPPILSQLLGLNGFRVSVVSRASTTTNASIPPCVILAGDNVRNGLVFNGGARFASPDCGIHGHSIANPVGVFNSGIRIDAAEICLQGTHIVNNAGRIDNLALGCTPEPDVLAGTIAPPSSTSCDPGLPRNINGGSIRLRPGVYCGGLNFNGNVRAQFDPGLYVIRNGNWNVNGGEWTGDGVTFYFDDTSKIQFNSGVQSDLTPPTSGTYENVLFFERPGLPRTNFVFNDTRGFELTGLIQLPSRDVTVNGNGNVRQRDALLVFNSLTFNNARWELRNELLAGSGTTTQGVAAIVR